MDRQYDELERQAVADKNIRRSIKRQFQARTNFHGRNNGRRGIAERKLIDTYRLFAEKILYVPVSHIPSLFSPLKRSFPKTLLYQRYNTIINRWIFVESAERLHDQTGNIPRNRILRHSEQNVVYGKSPNSRGRRCGWRRRRRIR
jgi:hypothetical protein